MFPQAEECDELAEGKSPEGVLIHRAERTWSEQTKATAPCAVVHQVKRVSRDVLLRKCSMLVCTSGFKRLANEARPRADTQLEKQCDKNARAMPKRIRNHPASHCSDIRCNYRTKAAWLVY